MKTIRITSIFLLFLLSGMVAFASNSGNEEAGEKKEKFNASAFIMDHISDSHEWHLFGEGETSVAIYLPVILYDKETGINVFSSKKLAHGHEYKGFRLEEEGPYKGKIVKVDTE
ncbi:MAG TPA: F0F1 ATP synthase subunit A, partial [Bacteroidales bacterium]|nr:F0F1 ATP synthase subunit A [Bacteroidales bacterium]